MWNSLFEGRGTVLGRVLLMAGGVVLRIGVIVYLPSLIAVDSLGNPRTINVHDTPLDCWQITMYSCNAADLTLPIIAKKTPTSETSETNIGMI